MCVFILECLSLFVAEVTFLFPPNQNSAGAAVSEQYGIKCVFFLFFVCMHALYACACPRGKSNQRSCVVERLYKKE